MPSTSRGRKGKLGKNKHRIVVYYGEGRNLFNKARKVAHHVRRYGDNDKPANEAIKLALAGMPLGTSRKFNKLYET